MTPALDFLAIVSRPDFSSGSGPVGDYYNLRALINSHPEWNAAVLELNSRPTAIEWDPSRFVIDQDQLAPFDLNEVRVALYLPICLEVEETLLCPIDPSMQWPTFAAEQWRPVTAAFEERLARVHCLNRPGRVRRANNKLLQIETLSAGGFVLPNTAVSSRWPTSATLSTAQTVVAKNVSEGGWKSPEEFSPARIVERTSVLDPWPVIWQEPLENDYELRLYVMGDQVTAVALDRDPDVIDVRATNSGKPSAHIMAIPDRWTQLAIAISRCLELEYAVIDAIPRGDELDILEVNANGVWWFLPEDVGSYLESRFHSWLAAEIDRRYARCNR